MRSTKRQRVKSEPTVEERRKNPRVELLSDLYGCVVALDLPVLVRDASRGGFRIESECPFPVGSEHSFRFQTGGRPTTIMAVCRHIQRVNFSSRAFESRAAVRRGLRVHATAGRKSSTSAHADGRGDHGRGARRRRRVIDPRFSRPAGLNRVGYCRARSDGDFERHPDRRQGGAPEKERDAQGQQQCEQRAQAEVRNPSAGRTSASAQSRD